MYNITFITTIHDVIGKCNVDELCKIIEKIKPEVVFLEALEDTYSKYERHLFSSFGVYHKKLEIAAIQKYSFNNSFEYVPVLNNGLSDAFEKKYSLVCENQAFQDLIDNYNYLASEHGFSFLNSNESIKLHEEMRMEELRILNNIELSKEVEIDIDEYENSMLRNIYSFCKNSEFNSAIFMCGAAHRKSIIEKIDRLKTDEHVNLTWIVFENRNQLLNNIKNHNTP